MTAELFEVIDLTPLFGAEGRVRLTLLWIGGVTQLSAPHSAGAPGGADFGGDEARPAVPTGLAMASGFVLDADGTVRISIDFSWSANSEVDLDGYELHFRRQGDPNWTARRIGKDVTAHREVGVVANVTYEARILSIDQSGNRSAFSGTATHATQKDTTPPATPSGVTAAAAQEAILPNRAELTEADFSSVEVYRSTTNSRATATLVGNGWRTGFWDGGLQANTTYYYWTRAVDTSRNASPWSQPDAAGLAATTGGSTWYKLTLNQAVFSGTFTDDLATAAMVFDELSREVDWLIRQGSDLHWAETTQNAAIATSLGLKFSSESKVASAWDGADHQVAIVDSAGAVKYARLDLDGTIEQAPTAKFTPSGNDTYVRAVIAARGSSLHWALFLDQYDATPSFTGSKVQYARTDLAGAVQVSPTDITGTSSLIPGKDLRIGVDLNGDAHIFFRRDTVAAFQADAFQTDAFQQLSSQPMQYVKVDSAGAVLIAVSQPLTPAPGTTDVVCAGVLVDSAGVLHVIGYTYTGVGVMLSYGRMSAAGVVVVPQTLFFAAPTGVIFAWATMDTTLNQIYCAWLTTTAVYQMRLDPIVSTGLPLDSTLTMAAL